MSNKKKKKSAQKEPELSYEEQFLKILEPLGIKTMEEWYDAVYEGKFNWKLIKSETAGFEDLMDAVCAYEDDNCSEAQEFLFQHENHFIVWQSGSFVDGFSEDFVLPEIFDNLQDAELAFERQISGNEKPYDVQISEALDKLPFNTDRLDILPWSRFEHKFRVYYCGRLVLENMGSIDSKLIQTAIENLLKFEKTYNCEIIELFKEYREWNNNQRYYIIVCHDNSKNEQLRYRLHIPSIQQGRTRMPIELLEKSLNDGFRGLEILSEDAWNTRSPRRDDMGYL